jgi:tRNA pseudouridine38-40 synthase
LRRLAIGIEYDGTNYNGWQSQSHAPSIQSSLNVALSSVADEPVACIGAGRTDSGVHASGQIAHFDTLAERTQRSWLLGINSNLADDINVVWVKPVAEEFHARYSALSRSYRYVILNRPVRSALSRLGAWWVRQPLDIESMRIAAQYLLGRHDFSSFRASGCQAKTPVRELRRLDIEVSGEWVRVECEANAFLHHMVRNLMGSLVRVGRGVESPEWMRTLLASRDRRLADITAPAAGLVLTHVGYPPEFGLGGSGDD